MAIPNNLQTVIERKCNEIAQKFWGVKIEIPISVSARMSRTQGYVQFRINRTTRVISAVKMQFAQILFEGHFNEEYIDSILRHEVCHYALQKLNKPFGDTDRYFKSECSRINAPLRGIGPSKELQMKPFSYGLNTPTPKVEIPKVTPKKSTPKVEDKKVAIEVKPAQRIKNAFANMMSKLTKTQLNELTSEKFCANTFGLKYSFLKEYKSDEDRKVNGHNRYYSGTILINNKHYLMTNDLYKNNVEKFETYAKA